jgi:hypothetical protein
VVEALCRRQEEEQIVVEREAGNGSQAWEGDGSRASAMRGLYEGVKM